MGQSWGCCTLPSHFFSTTSFMDSWIMDQQLQHRSRSRVLRRRPKAAIRGRRRRKAAIGQRPRYGGRRPASGRVEPAEHEARTLAKTPIRSGKERPLRPALVCSAASMPQRRHVSSQQRHTPCHGAFATCPSTLPPSTNRNRLCPLSPTSVRYFWA